MADTHTPPHLPQNPDQTPALPTITRHRQEPKRRALRVQAITDLGPHMRRITLVGPDLGDFSSPGFDDHVKLILAPATETSPAVMREYTPRRFDPAAQELVLDFALHEAGPATAWALSAAVGQDLIVAGPRGSAVISGPIRHWLLIGDETALPAIGRFIDEAPQDLAITALIAVPGPADQQAFAQRPGLVVHWLHRPQDQAADPAPLLATLEPGGALADLALDAPGLFAWVAAEGAVARALRAALLARGLPLPWLKARGYWVQGQADTTASFD